MLTYESQLGEIMPTALTGTVVRTVGTTVAAAGFPSPVGAIAEIMRPAGRPLVAEVIGFRDDLTLLYPLENVAGVRRGDRVRLRRTRDWIRVGESLLGRVVDARGVCLDGRPQPALVERTAVHADPPPATDSASPPRYTNPPRRSSRRVPWTEDWGFYSSSRENPAEFYQTLAGR